MDHVRCPDHAQKVPPECRSTPLLTSSERGFVVDEGTKNNLRLVVEWASQPQLVTRDRLALLFYTLGKSVASQIGHENAVDFINHFIAVELAAGHPDRRQMLIRMCRTDML